MRASLPGVHLHSRVQGKAALVRALHSLHRRVVRFATCRRVTPAEYAWALTVCGTLERLLLQPDVESETVEHQESALVRGCTEFENAKKVFCDRAGNRPGPPHMKTNSGL
jgi:hypothetical protein